jgi:predicted PurR-regulated permease PerM
VKTSSDKYPSFLKVPLVLISLAIITIALYTGQKIFIPLFLALLFAVILRPAVVFLNIKLRFPHVISTLVSVVLFVILIIATLLFISWQISYITNDWNSIQCHLEDHFDYMRHWIKQQFNISYQEQGIYLQQAAESTVSGNNSLAERTFNSFTEIIINLALIPIYTFLILLYRNLFIKFLYTIMSEENQNKLQDILCNVKTVVQGYLLGLLFEMGIVGLLTTGGLMFLGIQYAVLLGAITAILNLIPYIGAFTAFLITILVVLVTSTGPSVIIAIILLNLLVQFIDNNILVPKIVGTKIRVNALASMVGIILGGAIAGVAGMFLAIPILAILKVIFDRVEHLKPFGLLIGDDLPKTYGWHKIKLPAFNIGTVSNKNKG